MRGYFDTFDFPEQSMLMLNIGNLFSPKSKPAGGGSGGSQRPPLTVRQVTLGAGQSMLLEGVWIIRPCQLSPGGFQAIVDDGEAWVIDSYGAIAFDHPTKLQIDDLSGGCRFMVGKSKTDIPLLNHPDVPDPASTKAPVVIATGSLTDAMDATNWLNAAGGDSVSAPAVYDVRAYRRVQLEAHLDTYSDPGNTAKGVSPFIVACDVNSTPVAGLSVKNVLANGLGNNQNTPAVKCFGCILAMGDDIDTFSGVEVGADPSAVATEFDDADANSSVSMSKSIRPRFVRCGYFLNGTPTPPLEVTLSLIGYP